MKVLSNSLKSIVLISMFSILSIVSKGQGSDDFSAGIKHEPVLLTDMESDENGFEHLR